MITDLLSQFMNSPAAAEAIQHLQDNHGLDAGQAQAALAATAHAHGQDAPADGPQAAGLGAFGNAMVGGIGGLVSGSGMIQGGLSAVVAGKAAELIAQRTGMSPSTASTVAAAAAPFILKYLQGSGASASQSPQQVTKESKPEPVSKQSK